jgi:hypothetical protein
MKTHRYMTEKIQGAEIKKKIERKSSEKGNANQFPIPSW